MMKKSARHGPDAATEMDTSTYARHMQQLKKEESKAIKNRAAVQVLMRETSSSRRKWILEDRPPVEEVLLAFSSLQEYEHVSE